MWFPTVMSITLQAESQKIEVDAWDLKGSAGILDFFFFFFGFHRLGRIHFSIVFKLLIITLRSVLVNSIQMFIYTFWCVIKFLLKSERKGTKP